MNIRSFVFKSIDAIKGGTIQRHLNLHLSSSPNNEAREVTHKLLEELLKHAQISTNFYRSYTSADIADFPIVDKNIIREQADSFLSKKFSTKELFKMVTSGSTGTPFQTYQDKEKKIRNTADTIYFAGLAGYKLGEELFYLKIWSDLNKKNRQLQWIQNIHPIDVLHLNDRKIENLIKMLERNQSPKHILGYSSALEKIAKYFDRTNITFNGQQVKSIISMSEGLNDYTKIKLKEKFRVQPCSRYSNIENGIIAQQTPESASDFLTNTVSYFVEIFDINENRLAIPGELGRIVVTDLYNYGMPLIRYDTGDLGSMPLDNNGKVQNNKLNRIEGRKLDTIFDTKGRIISSYIIYKNMWKYTEIAQYQLIQEEAKKYRFKINTDGVFRKEKELKGEFLKYLGEDATFEIEYVKEIPLLDSGKRRKVVNHYLRKLNELNH